LVRKKQTLRVSDIFPDTQMGCLQRQMTRKFNGFISRLKRDSPDIYLTRCVIHREALMTKTIPDELKIVHDLAIKMH